MTTRLDEIDARLADIRTESIALIKREKTLWRESKALQAEKYHIRTGVRVGSIIRSEQFPEGETVKVALIGANAFDHPAVYVMRRRKDGSWGRRMVYLRDADNVEVVGYEPPD